MTKILIDEDAVKRALEALEAGEYYIDDLEAIVYAADDIGVHEDRAKMQAAITTLRKALADNALDKKAENARELGLDYEPAPVAKPHEQEPVAWMYPDDYERMSTSETFCTVYSVAVGSATRGESTVALYTSPPAQKRPQNCGTSYCSCIECVMEPAQQEKP